MTSLDAVDCLLAFGYTIIKAPAPFESLPVFQLCPNGADLINDTRSIGLLLQEIDENKEYYTRRIIAIGKELL